MKPPSPKYGVQPLSNWTYGDPFINLARRMVLCYERSPERVQELALCTFMPQLRQELEKAGEI